nr:hypothetical protein [Escherichia coli]
MPGVSAKDDGMQIVIHVPQRVNEESVPGHNRLSRNIDERRPILPCQQRMKSFKAIDIIFLLTESPINYTFRICLL